MTRVAVIGNASGGKSTLSRKLSQARGLELYMVDHVQWRPGWVPAPVAEVRQQLDAILARERWIIDGWGPQDTLAARFAAADTIILVDHPLSVHYWWAIKRQLQCLIRPREDGPPACPMLPMTWPLLKMIWHIHSQVRPALLALVHEHREDRLVFHLRSPRELRQFVARYC